MKWRKRKREEGRVQGGRKEVSWKGGGNERRKMKETVRKREQNF